MRYTTRENRHVLALGNQVLYGDRIVSVIYCGALALEEFELASYLPFLMDSGPDWSKMVDPVEEQRAAPRRMLPPSNSLFYRGLTLLRLSGSQAMWPAPESVQHAWPYGLLPSDHLPSSDRPLSYLPFVKKLHLGRTGQSVLALLQPLGLSENVRVFVTLPNTITEDGPCSSWLIRLRGRQGIIPDHTNGVY